jgi:CubicO group peptidase (beta-lactamase class C family)
MRRRRFIGLAGLAALNAIRPVSARVPSGAAGPDAAALAALKEDARRLDRLKSIVVSHRERVVLAEAAQGPPVDKAVNIKSVSKTLVATLVGCAQQRGVIESVEQTLGSLVPTLVPTDADPRVAGLTLENLMTMQAGLERVSGAGYGRWVNSDNWIRYVLTRPFVDEPGARMLYSTGSTHVLGVVLSELTGESLYTLANSWLGKPLSIDFSPWTRDPQGYYMGGNEMSLSPLHLVRVGELYLSGGVVDGKQVLPRTWVQDGFVARTRSPYSGDGYGYGWFLRDMNGHSVAYARGYGGQVLYVAPELELVVAITSDTTQRARSNGYMSVLHDLVARHLVG